MGHNFRQKHKQNQERSQSIARIVITGSCTLILFFCYFFNTVGIAALSMNSSYFIFSLVWLIIVQKNQGNAAWRRHLIIFTDLLVISIGMHLSEKWGAGFYFLYLWVIVGNGMRFGTGPLLEAMTIGSIGFVTTIAMTEYWQNNLPMATGLTVGLIVLPIFYLVLIRRLHALTEQLEQELNRTTYAATHDTMTGLANRAYFFQRVTDKIHEAERFNENFAILFIDLDGFKLINDTYGHAYGDETLKITANRLQQISRKSDLIARLGGDEFSLMLQGTNTSENFQIITQRILSLLSQTIHIDGHPLHVTASIGISQYPIHGITPDKLINEADAAMYQSKKSGKNRYTFNIPLETIESTTLTNKHC